MAFGTVTQTLNLAD